MSQRREDVMQFEGFSLEARGGQCPEGLDFLGGLQSPALGLPCYSTPLPTPACCFNVAPGRFFPAALVCLPNSWALGKRRNLTPPPACSPRAPGSRERPVVA